MDPSAVRNMIESGHASVAHVAKHFDTTPAEVEAFLHEHDIKRPNALAEQYKHIRKLSTAQRPTTPDWELLVYDDPEKKYLNGIDMEGTDGRINAEVILAHYYDGPLVCWFSGDPTDTVAACDGNAGNFIVSNLLPVTREIAKERQIDSGLPMMVASKTYGFKDVPFSLTLHLQGRLDPSYGSIINETYLDEVIGQWIEPYLTDFSIKDILPEGFPPTPEYFILWMWRHLSTVAMLKGIARIDVRFGSVEAFMSKESYLQVVVGLMQRAVQSRAIARPAADSGLVTASAGDIQRLTP